MEGELGVILSFPQSHSQIFRESFPYYLSIGMSAEQFWDGDAALVLAYRKAEKLRFDRKNHELWLQGMYIYEAFADVSPLLHAFAKRGTKATPYSAEPYKFEKTKKKEEPTAQEAENERLKAALFFKNWARANQRR